VGFAEGEAMEIGDFEIRTFAQTKTELLKLERELAQELGLYGVNVRRSLIELDRAGELPESELVDDWHDLYARFLNSTKAEFFREPEPRVEPPPRGEATSAPKRAQSEAAEAASLLLCTQTAQYSPMVVNGCPPLPYGGNSLSDASYQASWRGCAP
jgi:hypothetical protein